MGAVLVAGRMHRWDACWDDLGVLAPLSLRDEQCYDSLREALPFTINGVVGHTSARLGDGLGIAS